mgnify:FL=1
MVEDLQKRQSEQADLLKRARTELITAESDLSALRVERTEIEGNYLRDKEDVRDMKKKMAEVGGETVKIKDVLEKLKKEARQQKGLVAISKKQLATAEAEKEKAAAAILEEQRELDEAKRELELAPVEQATDSPFDFPSAPVAAAFPLPISPPSASPAASVRSNNPFGRMGSISGAISPQPTGTHTSSPLTLPAVAAVAAVGAGVVASNVFEDDEAKEEQDPFGFPTSASKEVEDKDPFGLPTGTTSPPTEAFDSAFADGFGDDFSSAPATSAIVAPSSAFDDAFAELDESVPFAEQVEEAKVEEPVVGEEKEEETAVEEVKEEAVVEEAKEEPVVDESKEVEEAVEEVEAAAPVEDAAEEPDSSDDEVEIEDATPAPHGACEASDSTFPVATTSTSDSGESFVHVPSGGVDADAESKFPALETLEEPVVTAAPEQTGVPAESAASEEDTFGADAAEATVFDEPPPRESSADGTTSTKKRAAPPPPPHRASAQSATVSSPPATATPVTDSPSAFDDAFGSSFDDTPATTSAPSETPVVAQGSVDDFEDAFRDLPPSAPISTSSAAPQPTNDFDTFDDDFSFKPDFAPPPPSGAAFDDSFAEFDEAFEPAHSAQSPVSPLVAAEGQAFSFDDTFGEPVLGKATPPNVPARPVVGAALEDDVAGVKQIVGMGFSRDQAIEALEKYNVRFFSLLPFAESWTDLFVAV